MKHLHQSFLKWEQIQLKTVWDQRWKLQAALNAPTQTNSHCQNKLFSLSYLDCWIIFVHKVILDELDGESALPNASSSNHHQLVLSHAWKEPNTTTRSRDFPSDLQPMLSFNQLILSSSSSHWHSEDSDLDLRRDLKVWSSWPLLECISSDNGEDLKCLNALTFARQESVKRSFNVQTDQWD